MTDLTGRTALVTGAGRGLGAGIARGLAEAGAAIAVNDLDAALAEEAVDSLRALGHQAVAAVADVTSPDEMRRALAEVAPEVGAPAILVNNAGLPPGSAGGTHFLDTKPGDWQAPIAVSLHGVLTCCHLAAPAMVAAGWGRIITIVSDAGRVGEPGWAVYGAAKAAAAGFTRSLAKEIGPAGVTVNALSLGTIQGPSTSGRDAEAVARQVRRYPMRRLGSIDDVIPAVLWLASDEAGWVTGQTIPVNGGYSTS